MTNPDSLAAYDEQGLVRHAWKGVVPRFAREEWGEIEFSRRDRSIANFEPGDIVFTKRAVAR